MTSFRLWLDGTPPSRHEPLWGKRGLYPNPRTEACFARWRAAWLATSDRPYIGGAVSIELTAFFRRPPSHLLQSGALSAAGRRAGLTHTARPDLDNVCKGALDALKGRAIDDDANVIEASLVKLWSRSLSGVEIIVRSATRVPATSAFCGLDEGEPMP